MAMARSTDRRRHWRKVIERQQGSGQSIVAFCAQAMLNPATFHAWKRRLFGGQAKTGKTVARALVPVQIVGDPAGGGGTLEMLADYHGYLQTDGYIVYTSMVREAAGRLVDVACWAHGRRNFEAERITCTSAARRVARPGPRSTRWSRAPDGTAWMCGPT